MADHATCEQASRSEKFLRALTTNGYALGDPSFPTDSLLEALLLTAVDQADRLAALERTLTDTLSTAYDNYDPIVAQLSEVRREIARMRTGCAAELADRDRLWCEALLSPAAGHGQEGLDYVQATLAAFAKLCEPKDREPSW